MERPTPSAPIGRTAVMRLGLIVLLAVAGLTTGDDPKLPLMADGFVEGAPGQYTDDPSKKGGLWKGTNAIVVFVDGSAFPWPISAKDGFRVLRRKADKSRVDVFTREGGLPDGARVLNPW